jgi:hypothetical protein
VVTGLTLSFADDHLKNEKVVLGSASDLNHVDLLRDARVLKGSGHVHITRISDFSVFRPSWSGIDSSFLGPTGAAAKGSHLPRANYASGALSQSPFRSPAFLPTSRYQWDATPPDLGPAE